MKKSFVFTALLVAVAFMPASATIIYVPSDNYPTIQAGIDASSNGDTVLVQEGTYVENINFNGHNITLGSLFLTTENPSYISSTIIDGGASGTTVTFENGEDNTAIITGFTIQNGHAPHGGGIHCWHSCSPTINYNTISGNSASDLGGGIFCYINSNPTINNNTISENSADSYGGAIYCYSCSPTISNNTISGNSAEDGGGIYCQYYNPTINNNTISRNSADNLGGGIYCDDSNPVITNTIFWGDTAPHGAEIHLSSSSPVITYCDIQGGWDGETNINCNPMFCDSDNGNFYLDAASCCVGAGEGGVNIGAFGVGCGEEIPTLSEWGMIVLALLLLAFGTVAVVRMRKTILSRSV